MPAAYEGAAELAACGLSYVLAPIRADDGAVVHQLGDYPVVVFPYTLGESLDRVEPSYAEIAEAVDLLDRLHGETVIASIPTENFELGFALDLDHAIHVAHDTLADVGPYSRRLHRILRRNVHRITNMRIEFETVAAACASAVERSVLTHGQPISSNIMRTPAGLKLIDWGDLMWAPPERDWIHVRRTLGVEVKGRPDVLHMYDLKWILSEIAEYAVVLSSPHVGSRDDTAMWERLLWYLDA